MNVVIIGAGGHGKVVLDILRAAGQYSPVGFIDADVFRAGSTAGGLPVLGSINMLPKLRRQDVAGAIVAIGDNRVRRSYAGLVFESGLQLISAIHPSAIISPMVNIGTNVVVAAGAILCTEVRIADSVIVNTGATIDHECQVGPAVHICPGSILAGRVQVEEEAFIGMGAKLLPCVRIGARAVVGAGAVVREDVAEGTTVVGVPARMVRREDARKAGPGEENAKL
jgi:UDP-perosamine 4-acetyltransferase